MTGRTYASPAAMRAALEQRLLDRSKSARLPPGRLRKEAAIQRLLARIAAEAPAGSWALKGGIAMIARVAERPGPVSTWSEHDDGIRMPAWPQIAESARKKVGQSPPGLG